MRTLPLGERQKELIQTIAEKMSLCTPGKTTTTESIQFTTTLLLREIEDDTTEDEIDMILNGFESVVDKRLKIQSNLEMILNSLAEQKGE